MIRIFCFQFLLLSLVVAGTQQVTAQEIRAYSNEFLNIGVGARGLAMGNAQVASVDDVTAAYWNPAGISRLQNTQVGAMHAEWFAGIAKYDYLGIAFPINNKQQFLGVTAIRLGVDDVPNTLNLVEPDGSINYDNISTFSVADYGFLFTFAQKIKKVRLGANVKLIHRRVGTFATAWGFGLDLGLQYAPVKGLNLALSIKDATTTYNAWGFNFTEEEKAQLAATDNLIPVNSVELTGQKAILGAAYNWRISEKIGLLSELNLGFTFDGRRNTLVSTNAFSMDPHAGIEFNYDQFIFLRTGINNIQEFTNDNGEEFTSLQPNVGVGLKIKEIKIDYAFTGLNRTSDGLYSHVVSLLINFTKKGKTPDVEQ